MKVPVSFPLPLDSIGLQNFKNCAIVFRHIKFDDDQAKALAGLNNEEIILEFTKCELPLDKDGRNILFDAICDSPGRIKFRFDDTEILVGKEGGDRGKLITKDDRRFASLMLVKTRQDKIGPIAIDFPDMEGRVLGYHELVAYKDLSDALGTRLEKPLFLIANNSVNGDAKILVKDLLDLGSICPWEPKLTKTKGEKCSKCANLDRFCSLHQSKGSAILEVLGYKTPENNCKCNTISYFINASKHAHIMLCICVI